jgi:alcohol dehydrogenase class IV
MNFEFATAQRILFGSGAAQQIAENAAALGKRAFLLTGEHLARHPQPLDRLESMGLVAGSQTIAHEPDITLIQELTQTARTAKADMVIAIGGGSVIDAGKAVAAMLNNQGDLLDYLEVVGKGRALSNPSASIIAMPTTAGTGAEVTRNAVLAVPQADDRPGVKVSMRSPYMLPTLALVDPTLTHSLPPAITATTGMDALTQCLEPYVSAQANPLTDGLAQEGMRRAARALRQACGAHETPNAPEHVNAREDMCIASLCGGLALANAKLGAVHGFAGVIGGMFPAPHGAVCARLLPPVFACNAQAVAERGPAEILARFDQVARILTGSVTATAADGIEWLQALIDDLPIPRLREFGLTPVEFDPIIRAAARSSSMQGNPVVLTESELHNILEESL